MTNKLFHLHRKLLDPNGALAVNALRTLKELNTWRPCPQFLGNFSFITLGPRYGKPVPGPIGVLHPWMASTLAHATKSAQAFNTIFLQRYLPGQYVRPHRDPKNNLGYTVILTLGEWVGAETTINQEARFTMRSGDALAMRCNLHNQPRPLHRVSPVLTGVRYSVIINTIQ